MWDIVKALWDHWRGKDKKPTPQPQHEPPKPEPEKPEEGTTDTPDALPVHPPEYSDAGATVLAKRESGFVNNPDNSRRVLKIILPAKYSGKVSRVIAYSADGRLRDVLKRYKPNEYGNRQRYYGTQAPASYPLDLHIRWDTTDGDFVYILANPAAREG